MIEVDNEQDLDNELKRNKRILALFYASWCPFCVGFVPIFNEKVASLGIKNVVYVLLDDYNNPLWDDYNIPAVPTIILFEDGKVCRRIDAHLGLGLSETAFKKWIEEFKHS